MKTVCQALVAALFIASLFINIYWDVNGKAARKPRGFRGVVETIVIMTIFVLVYWQAGAFSNLLGAL